MMITRLMASASIAGLALALAACEPAPMPDPEPAPLPPPAPEAEADDGGMAAAHDAMLEEADAAALDAPGLIEGLSALCGQSFEGAITSPPVELDGAFAGQRLVMHVRECFDDEVRVPFHVGDDHSRTWLITRLDDGRLRLKHDHRHDDGSEDTLTQYGGESVAPPVSARVEFPADQFSKDLFEREGIPVSMDNIWIMEVADTTFTYTLTRPNRFFEVTFDLTNPVDTPPTPWGWEELE
ncbi:MAG: hypothetical protein ACK4NO_02415 [Glycocaulis sp.]